MMPTDTERREVARRLREIRLCKSGHIEWWRIAQALGLKEPAGWFGWGKFEPESVQRLADLIEPDTTTDTTKSPELTTKCDRGALLALADEMEEFGNLPVKHPGIRVLHNDDFSRELGYARRIREAVGA